MRQIHRLLFSLLLAWISAPSPAEALPHLIQQDGRHALILLDVELGPTQNGVWVMGRRWNGDEVDYGLNLVNPTLLKVRLGTYQ